MKCHLIPLLPLLAALRATASFRSPSPLRRNRHYPFQTTIPSSRPCTTLFAATGKNHVIPPAPPPSSRQKPGIVKPSSSSPSPIRYSHFLKLVNAGRVEKVTLTSDGTSLLGINKDGTKIRIDTLPSDVGLLTQLTRHKVDVTVLPRDNSIGSGVVDLFRVLFFPALLFVGMLFLRRRSSSSISGDSERGGRGLRNPLNFGKARTQ
mmetsp:Transcript_39802/g.48488  ORF Transcript_39802/g.48488 Transcript_39802/m.48488 type:complete len:206 (+) Transcript_39802:2-619(+)